MMAVTDSLVSILLPVRNGERTIDGVVRSVLRQDHDNIEILISDNASTDGTGELCRELALLDPRITYHRQPVNVGMMGNFVASARMCRGRYFRWVGHDDWLDPSYVSRCLAAFAVDERRVLVTTQLAYTQVDGSVETAGYRRTDLGSEDPVRRLDEILRLQTESYLLLDPMYGLLRRDTAVGILLRPTLRGDEVYSARLALAGPWAHIPEVLGGRDWHYEPRIQLATKIGVPRVHAGFGVAQKYAEVYRRLDTAGLSAEQRRRAGRMLAAAYVRHHAVNIGWRIGKTIDLAGRRTGRGSTPRRMPPGAPSSVDQTSGRSNGLG